MARQIFSADFDVVDARGRRYRAKVGMRKILDRPELCCDFGDGRILTVAGMQEHGLRVRPLDNNFCTRKIMAELRRALAAERRRRRRFEKREGGA